MITTCDISGIVNGQVFVSNPSWITPFCREFEGELICFLFAYRVIAYALYMYHFPVFVLIFGNFQIGDFYIV